MEKLLHDNVNSLDNEVDDDLEDGEILDEEYDTEKGESTERNTELKASKANCLEEDAKQKNVVAGNDEEISRVRGGTNNLDLSNFRDCENKVDEDLEDGEILDEENDTDFSHLAESSKRNTEHSASKKTCLEEGEKQKNFEHLWDMDQRHQQSTHQQIILPPLHNNFSGFNNRSRDRVPINKRVITKRALSYQRDDDRGRKRLKVYQNHEDNERTNEEERCTFVNKELACKYYHTVDIKYHSNINCRFGHDKLDEERKRKTLKNNLEKKPLLSIQTYDQPFLDDLSDDDEFNGLVIDEENFQNDVKDQLLPENQKEPFNKLNMAKSTEKNTELKEFKENCVGDSKEEKLKYYLLPCEVSVRDYSDIPPTVGIDDPRLRKTITAAKDPLSIQNYLVRDPPLQTPNPLQPSIMDIDMRHMLPPIMTCPQTMAILNDSHRKPTVPRDPRLQRHRFDVDQRLNDRHFF